jgi:hypothetical protein
MNMEREGAGEGREHNGSKVTFPRGSGPSVVFNFSPAVADGGFPVQAKRNSKMLYRYRYIYMSEQHQTQYVSRP